MKDEGIVSIFSAIDRGFCLQFCIKPARRSANIYAISLQEIFTDIAASRWDSFSRIALLCGIRMTISIYGPCIGIYPVLAQNLVKNDEGLFFGCRVQGTRCRDDLNKCVAFTPPGAV